MDKKIILGLHDQDLIDAYSIIIQSNRYVSYIAPTPQIMFKEIEMSNGGYQRVLMDANFGKPGEVDISPSKRVRSLLEQRIKNGEVKLLALSSNLKVIEALKKEGIQASDKYEFTPEKLEEFLQ